MGLKEGLNAKANGVLHATQTVVDNKDETSLVFMFWFHIPNVFYQCLNFVAMLCDRRGLYAIPP